MSHAARLEALRAGIFARNHPKSARNGHAAPESGPARGKKERNYTRVPNAVFDVWLAVLGKAEIKVLLYLIRRTAGFNKEVDGVGLSQICAGIVTTEGVRQDAGTGLARHNVVAALESLEARGLIGVTRVEKGQPGHARNTYRVLLGQQGERAPPG